MAKNRDGSGRFKPGISGNQAGRPRKQDAAPEPHGDGWANQISGFGNTARDKRLSTTFCADDIDDAMAQELWRGDPVGARAVEVWPTEMLRAGWEICVPEAADKERTEDIGQTCEDLALDDALIEAMSYQRAYGGGAILMGINDGRLPQEPVDPARVNSIDWLTTLEPREIQPRYWYANPMAPKFGQVELWQVTPQTQGAARDFSFGASIDIHESRLLVFNGVRVSRLQHSQRSFWGDSIFTRLFATLRDFNSVYSSLGVLMHELGTPIWEIDNLAQLVTSKDKSALANRVAAMDFCKSVIRAVVIAKGEIYRRDQMSFAGVPDVLDRFAQKLSAALDGMPLTMLLGISPTGLGSTGESEIKIFNSRVAWKQKKELRPILKRFLTLLWAGKPPEKWSIEFAPLSQPTDKETADTRKIVMDTVVAGVDAQIITPEEGRQSMYGGDKFSMEIQLDPTLTAAEDFQEPPAPVLPGAPPGGGAPPDPGAAQKDEPPPTVPKAPAPRTDGDPDQPRDESGRWGSGGARVERAAKETDDMARIYEKQPGAMEEVYGKGVATREAAVAKARAEEEAAVAGEGAALEAGHIVPMPSAKREAFEREAKDAAAAVGTQRQKLESKFAEFERARSGMAGNDGDEEGVGASIDIDGASRAMASASHSVVEGEGDPPEVSRQPVDGDGDGKVNEAEVAGKLEALHDTAVETLAMLKDRKKSVTAAARASRSEAQGAKVGALVKVGKGDPARASAKAAAETMRTAEIEVRERAAGGSSFDDAIGAVAELVGDTSSALKRLRGK